MSNCFPTVSRFGGVAMFSCVLLALVGVPHTLEAQFREVLPSESGQNDAGTRGLAPLVRVITTTIEPDTWDEVGGAGSIESVDGWGMVIVSQTGDVHDKIADLIGVLRKARASQEGTPANRGDKAGTPKAVPVSLVAESEQATVARKRIVTLLDSEASLEFLDTPLSEVVAFLRNKHKVPAYIDSRALEEVGMGADTPVSSNLKGVSLRAGIRLMLGQLGLTTVIKDDVLKITTPEQSEYELITRVYPVKDLAIAPPAKD